MADILPFRAYYYSASVSGNLPDLVCPPYDVISDAQHEKLLARDPANFVRVERPSGRSDGKYESAARFWRQWLEKGIIRRDIAPACYVYEASFRSKSAGRPLRRRGFFAGLRTVPWGRGVYPHEKTLPTHKADRMKLFKALKIQTSPIQCLFDDKSGKAEEVIRQSAASAPWMDLKDDEGVRHRFWRIDAPDKISALEKALRGSPVVIADGHHRYETARAYGVWARSKWKNTSPASGYVMTYFCPVDDPGLEILPTHRAVGWDKRRFVNLEKWGSLAPVRGLKSLEPLMQGKLKSKSVGVFFGGRYYRYDITRLPPELRKTPSAGLSVPCLHAGALKGLGKEDFVFSQDPKKIAKAAADLKGWGFFVPPTALRDVLKVATAGRVMPPKSTYFYPKIPSGLLSHSLWGDL